MPKILSNPLRAVTLTAALALVSFYRVLISPMLVLVIGPACRFQPTCSEYAYQALSTHGPVRGIYLTLRRILRCRPRGAWGYDPVPARNAPKISHF